MVGSFVFYLSLSLVTWAVCMVCQETTVPRSLPEPPMWPLSSDSSWSLWISTGLAPAPSSLTRNFWVSAFSVLGEGLRLCSTRKTVLMITYQNFSIIQKWESLHFSQSSSCLFYQHSYIMYQLFCSSCHLFFSNLWVISRVMRYVNMTEWSC